MPNIQPPPFSYIKYDNTTVTFVDMISNLGSGILVLPLISLMEDIAICKAFCKLIFFLFITNVFHKILVLFCYMEKKERFSYLFQQLENQLMQHKN